MLHKEKGMAAVSAELKRNTSIQGLLEEIQKKLNISVENSTFDFDKSALFTTVIINDILLVYHSPCFL